MRHPSNIPIEVSEGSQPEQHAMHDVSLGGLSFDASARLEVGSVVDVRITFVRPIFSTQARVVWCSQVAQHYEIGVEFLESADAFRARMVEQVCHIEHYRQTVLRNEGRGISSQDAALEWIALYAATFPRADS